MNSPDAAAKCELCGRTDGHATYCKNRPTTPPVPTAAADETDDSALGWAIYHTPEVTEHQRHMKQVARAELADLRRELADAQHWRERHCADAEARGRQTVEQFEEIKRLTKLYTDTESRLGEANEFAYDLQSRLAAAEGEARDAVVRWQKYSAENVRFERERDAARAEASKATAEAYRHAGQCANKFLEMALLEFNKAVHPDDVEAGKVITQCLTQFANKFAESMDNYAAATNAALAAAPPPAEGNNKC